MSDLSQAGSITEYGKLTNSTTTTIYTASLGTTRVRSVTACDNTGGTTAWTLEINDGTNSYYKRKAKALTAGIEDVVNEPFQVPQGWTVKITSADAAGKIDWMISYDNPSAASRLRN